MRSLISRPPSLKAARFVRVVSAAVLVLVAASSAARAQAHSYLVFDVKSGQVLSKMNAHQAWYPASVTKLMTTWVTFQAIRSGRMKMTSPVVMTEAANRQPPSKMGFPVGTIVTVDNALKIIMVKSANDVAWALGEAVSGSEDAFVAEMNGEARRLGMTATRWGNPNGLPDPTQVTTAHDLGLLARALIKEFPEYGDYFRLPGIQFGKISIKNHNHLVNRFPGTDGMKTGFICASGFNVVASATRDGRRLVTIVLGSPNARVRAEKAAELFTRGFEQSGGIGSWFGEKETIDNMRPGPEAALPVEDIRKEVCGPSRKAAPQEEIEEGPVASEPQSDFGGGLIVAGQTGPRRAKAPGQVVSYLTKPFDIGPNVKVWTGGADPLPGAPPTAVAGAPGPVDAKTTRPPAPSVAAFAPERAPGSLLPGTIDPATGQPVPSGAKAGDADKPPAEPVTGKQAMASAFGLFTNGPSGKPIDLQPPPVAAPPPVVVAAAPPPPPPVPGTPRSVELPAAAAPAYPVPKARPANFAQLVKAAKVADDSADAPPKRKK
jgi:D-alanyl-D-alanine carboxypeptidase